MYLCQQFFTSFHFIFNKIDFKCSMAKKIYITTSDELSDELFNEEQESVLENKFSDYVFIVAERGGATFANEDGDKMLIQEYF